MSFELTSRKTTDRGGQTTRTRSRTTASESRTGQRTTTPVTNTRTQTAHDVTRTRTQAGNDVTQTTTEDYAIILSFTVPFRVTNPVTPPGETEDSTC